MFEIHIINNNSWISPSPNPISPLLSLPPLLLPTPPMCHCATPMPAPPPSQVATCRRCPCACTCHHRHGLQLYLIVAHRGCLATARPCACVHRHLPWPSRCHTTAIGPMCLCLHRRARRRSSIFREKKLNISWQFEHLGFTVSTF